MSRRESKLKNPITLEAKGAEVYVGSWGSTQINDVDINKLFKKWLGEGTSTVNITISITPLDTHNTMLFVDGDANGEPVDLGEYVTDEAPEVVKEEDTKDEHVEESKEADAEK